MIQETSKVAAENGEVECGGENENAKENERTKMAKLKKQPSVGLKEPDKPDGKTSEDNAELARLK
jgi:hypothetical protein